MASVTPEAVQAAWEEAERERLFWHQHYQELLAKYRGQFVAVSEGQVVAAASDLPAFMKSLDGKGLKVQDVWVQYLADPVPFLL